MFKFDLLLQAEVELAEAYDWYEERQIGLGDRFYKEIDHYFERIITDPHLFPIRYPDDIRTAATKIFPFLIIFWINDSDSTIYILSVFHTSRDPQY